MQKGYNKLGFSHEHLEMIRNYCAKVTEKPRLAITQFHNKYSSFTRRGTTSRIINEAYDKYVITGPYLYCNSNIEVILLDDIDNPLQYWEEHRNDEGVTVSMALCGSWKYLCFRKGARSLKHTSTPLLSYPAWSELENFYFEEPGELGVDQYPHGWDELDWKMYDIFGITHKMSFVAVGSELEISWETVKRHYQRVLKQAKILTCFFPNGFYDYQSVLLTFKTKYEVGLKKALSELDRLSYLYKYNSTIILLIFIDRDTQVYNKITKRFGELEEMGIIHDLRVSIPNTYDSIYVKA